MDPLDAPTKNNKDLQTHGYGVQVTIQIELLMKIKMNILI